MKSPLIWILVANVTLATSVFAQAVPAMKEAGHATAETAKEAGDNVKAAVEKQPSKTVDKAKAQTHKAKAHMHGHSAKTDAKAAVQ